MYINSINYFRGISIIFIVLGHSLFLAGFSQNSILGNTIQNLTEGGTTFFVFISGFLFHHIFFKNFQFKGFMIKKTKYVLVPYLILSTIPVVYLVLNFCIATFLSADSHIPQYEELLAFPIFQHYLTGIGNNFVGYWYIPFIMIVFAMSPIFVRFINLKLKTSILIILFLLTSSVFMHKGTNYYTFTLFQNVIYFLPIYLIGILSSEKKEFLYSQLKGKEFYILTIAIVLLIFQTYMGEFGNYQKYPFTFDGIDFMLLQKILLCFFFMIFLNRFENYNFRFLELIAANSFGIFFMHGIVIVVFRIFKGKIDFSIISNSFILFCTIAPLIFLLSLIITLMIKRIFPSYSKYLVGN